MRDNVEFSRISLMWVLKAGVREIYVSKSGFEEGGKGHETRDVSRQRTGKGVSRASSN